MASHALVDVEWKVARRGGGEVVASRVLAETVINVDRTQEKPLPAGAKLLSSFLDEFDAHPDIARHLPQTRVELGNALADAKGGETLRDLRLKAGLSQKEFAVQIGSSQSRVSLLEGRKEKPSEDTLRAMARVLAVDFNTLMDALRRGDH